MLILNSDQLGGKKERDEINGQGSNLWKTFAILIFVRKSFCDNLLKLHMYKSNMKFLNKVYSKKLKQIYNNDQSRPWIQYNEKNVDLSNMYLESWLKNFGIEGNSTDWHLLVLCTIKLPDTLK